MRLVGQHLCPAGERLVQGPRAQANEHVSRLAPPCFVSHQDVCTRRAFGIRKLAVLALDQKSAQRDHEQNAE